ncbi:MAG: phosphoserine phosphatase SerB [SAR324 cluster bacterium]|nr:phosphoserine phosphatase SerB [SAR324 cluster bacterium]
MASPEPSQSVLITVAGEDRAGITAKLTTVIAEAGVNISDMEQVVVRGLLSLSIVLDFPPGAAQAQPVLKDLLFAAKEMGLELNFKVLPPHGTNDLAKRYSSVVTLIGHDHVSAASISQIATAISGCGFNIETIQHMDQDRVRCLELVVSSPEADGAARLKSVLLPVGRSFDVDIALQPNTVFRRIKRLVVFDLDSTLIQTEIIDELAAAAGKADQVRALTRRTMEGGLDFRKSLVRRVRMLKGLPEAILEEVYQGLPFTPGAKDLIRVLQRLGYRTAVISGGFNYFTDRIKNAFGLDYAFGNRLEIKDGLVTGKIIEPVIDGQGKAAILCDIARTEHIHLDQVIAIGDGANDLPMLQMAGLGIAFNARPAVQEAAEHSLSQTRLDAILFLLGITQEDVTALQAEL